MKPYEGTFNLWDQLEDDQRRDDEEARRIVDRARRRVYGDGNMEDDRGALPPRVQDMSLPELAKRLGEMGDQLDRQMKGDVDG